MISALAVAIVAAGSAAACDSSSTAGGAGASPSQAAASGPATTAAAPATTAADQGTGSVVAFCLDFAKAFGTGSADFNSRTASPETLELVNKLDSEAPPAVKSDMDAVAVNIRLLAKQDYTAVDTSGLSQGYQDIVGWIAQNCGDALQPSS